ncbi:hypothetical protein OG762_04090 [Streptomyces sp. NBC_01136]|uniref:DUF6777 domain-containing protein n=1 Tax=unclassified Streptomyces TaxID=2593676 RepID=UPI00324E9651|nr:hypothetical protein OG762_04090 [Streptomyces sp. NBC_01136]
MQQKTVVRIPTPTFLTACALSAALLVAGCGQGGDKSTASGASGGELFLRPVTAGGPDPFTESTAASPPVTRMPHTAAPTDRGSAPRGVRSFSGATPGLYGGTRFASSCDVEKQIGFLTADPRKARSFAQAEGVSEASVPDFLRGLTSVVLRADAQVTDHGFRDGRATTFQSVLQVGTAVLVDDRGVPRVRCAGGNPLNPPVVSRGTPATQGPSWAGFRPGNVVVVTPAPTVITHLTIIDVVDHAWIERRIGDDGHRDAVVRQPGTSAGAGAGAERSPRTAPSSEETTPDCAPVTATPGVPDGGVPDRGTPTETPAVAAVSDCITPAPTGPPSAPPEPFLPPLGESPAPSSTEIDRRASQEPPSALDPLDEEIGPDTVPEIPDLPDGGGLIPDESPDEDTVFDAPADVFHG